MAQGDRKEDMFAYEREQENTKDYLSVYVLRTSSMELQSFMPGIDVARYALVSITAPPF
jgi:hypothetical protein